jgi:putative hydrolase of HD superfamily
MDRVSKQIGFIEHLDQLKQVLRQNLVMDESRRENSAEHSWHMATMAMVLVEYAPQSLDQLRVLKMLLLHDVIEIEAGDTFCFDVEANTYQAPVRQGQKYPANE